MAQSAQKTTKGQDSFDFLYYLGYITLVWGLKIPTDDEKFEDGMFETFFTGVVFGVQFIYLKMLPFEDEPFYFESEEEAVELWKKHFPPG